MLGISMGLFAFLETKSKEKEYDCYGCEIWPCNLVIKYNNRHPFKRCPLKKLKGERISSRGVSRRNSLRRTFKCNRCGEIVNLDEATSHVCEVRKVSLGDL
ncbi:MAG: hypothetical protein KAU03_04030 [Candidatus Altiarchaeales archaeon]|nr:hypothetical protein [Candidatus Altiarchaeales archaeon]